MMNIFIYYLTESLFSKTEIILLDKFSKKKVFILFIFVRRFLAVAGTKLG